MAPNNVLIRELSPFGLPQLSTEAPMMDGHCMLLGSTDIPATTRSMPMPETRQVQGRRLSLSAFDCRATFGIFGLLINDSMNLDRSKCASSCDYCAYMDRKTRT